MIKILVLLFALSCPLILYSQSKTLFKKGVILSIKAGYHTGEASSPADNSVPPGFCIDGTAEIHTGKNWYLGFNYDVSLGYDTQTDQFNNETRRSVSVYSFSPLVKYRFISRNMALNVGFGIGGTSVVSKFDDPGHGENRDGMMNLNLRLGYDYMLKGGLLMSSELVYYGMAEPDIMQHGGSRSHSLFQIKAGLGYIFGK